MHGRQPFYLLSNTPPQPTHTSAHISNLTFKFPEVTDLEFNLLSDIYCLQAVRGDCCWHLLDMKGTCRKAGGIIVDYLPSMLSVYERFSCIWNGLAVVGFKQSTAHVTSCCLSVMLRRVCGVAVLAVMGQEGVQSHHTPLKKNWLRFPILPILGNWVLAFSSATVIGEWKDTLRIIFNDWIF